MTFAQPYHTPRTYNKSRETSPPARIIFHIDINSYFATILQQENPTLRGKPIGVTKSHGRHCVIASSNEAKKLGVTTGCSVVDAQQRSPNIVLVPAQFSIMLASTYKLKKVFQEFSPDVHIFSLDEAFLDMSGCELLMQPSMVEYAHSIQRRIKEVLGEWVQCNVGISHNKLLAKMAGEVAPKGTVLHITPTNLDEILSTVQFKDVCGIGYRLGEKLENLGVYTPYQINLLDDATLASHFGPFWGTQLRLIGKGEETHFFTHTPAVDHMQSVGRTITGYRLEDDEQEIKRILLNLLEEATYKLRAMDLAGRKVGVSLWGHNAYWGDYRTLKYWVRHTNEIFELLYEGMYKQWKRSFPIIKFGVWIGDLVPMDQVPQCWLPTWHKREIVYSVVDKVNNRFGQFTIRPATLGSMRGIIKPEVTGFLGDKKFLEL